MAVSRGRHGPAQDSIEEINITGYKGARLSDRLKVVKLNISQHEMQNDADYAPALLAGKQ